ncbi:hypothetical protein GGE12_006584 [Rhizobium mongolense]|uniref:Uncharacterized protein n=1 Tax=Rhizobium mongolense TaxID=57676 RepID=A0A7W6RUF7_9HYPH|nr:hypothetical protein [Rhizobium mongolense]
MKLVACGSDICRQQTAPHVSHFLLWGGFGEGSLAVREEGNLT